MTIDGLVVEDLTIRYGGRTAVDAVSLDAPVGRITGLIGPNGAGKTSTFNACSGLVPPAAGAVRLFGRDLTDASPSARARHGLGRTFQRTALFNSLSVRENVALGYEAGLAGRSPLRQIAGRRGDAREVDARVGSALERCGITDLGPRRCGDLSTGQRRLVELARVLAGDFRLLLLDEPSAGLDRDETSNFGAVLEDVVADEEVGILLVEHDMDLALSVCTYVFVLDFGRPLFEGTPAEVRSSPDVRSAYLGSVA